jgi:hypothetical protein
VAHYGFDSRCADLTEAPNYTQSHSHQFVNFTSEKLCTDAATKFESTLGKSTESGAKVTIRDASAQRK